MGELKKVLALGGLTLALPGCGSAGDALAPPPLYWIDADPDSVSQAFATGDDQRWVRYGDNAGPFRLRGTIIDRRPLKNGGWSVEIRAKPSTRVLGGIDIPGGLFAATAEGRTIDAFCAGVAIGPSSPGQPVLQSRCWLNRNSYR